MAMAAAEQSDDERRRRNLILIGFMGTGKTSVGKRVAASLGFRFVDTDELVVEKAGKSIPEIFAGSGEETFRDLERDALKTCAESENQVIATGGGIVLREANRQLLAKAGHVIWLKSDPQSILDRVSRNRNRPLVQTENPLKTICDLLAQREEFYRSAAAEEVNTSELTLDETAHGITESARVALGEISP
jgi:shikimate kinase